MRKPTTKPNSAPARSTSPFPGRSWVPLWLPAALLALVTLILYWPATGYDFVNYDDNVYVTDNAPVLAGLTWEGVRWAFTTGHAGYWQPFTWLSLMLDAQWFGRGAGGMHATNVVLHAANAGLVLILLRRLTGAGWRSLLVAALFAVHPLRVESVAWVTERKDVLSTFFGLLALICYARYATQSIVQSPTPKVFGIQSRVSYGLSLFFFALGLMSKPMLVTWPCVMLLLDYWPLGRVSCFRFGVSGGQTPNTKLETRNWLQLLAEKIPFFLLAAMSSVATFVAQKQGGAVAAVASLPLSARGGNALISYCRYLGKMFWPTDLTVLYPHPGYWPLAGVAAAAGLLAGISALLWVQRRRHPFLLVGWLWYVGTLVPVIGLVQSGEQALADRFTYVPSLGVLMAVIWGVYELTRRWRYPGLALSVAGSAAIVLCLGLTREQLGYWQDSETLFRHALAVTENNHTAHNNLGNTLLKKNQTDEAIRQYQAAIRLKPNYADAHYNLGVALFNQGRVDEAIRQYQETIHLQPDYAKAHNNLGNALLKQGQTDEAVRQYQAAIRLSPGDADTRYNLGVALLNQGRIDEAIRQLREAIRLRPDHVDAHNNLGAALLHQGHIDEAIRQYQEALRLRPDYAIVRNNLDNALGRKSQTAEAIRQYSVAIRMNPDDPNAHNNLGAALLNQGRVDEAVRQFQEAIRLRPDYAAARNNLGTVLLNQGQIDEAVRQFQEAVRLRPDYAAARNNLTRALELQSRARVQTSDPVKP